VSKRSGSNGRRTRDEEDKDRIARSFKAERRAGQGAGSFQGYEAQGDEQQATREAQGQGQHPLRAAAPVSRYGGAGGVGVSTLRGRLDESEGEFDGPRRIQLGIATHADGTQYRARVDVANFISERRRVRRASGLTPLSPSYRMMFPSARRGPR
jgi:hypothetical protein